MITYRELVTSLRSLGVESGKPVIVHASLSAFGHVSGGVDTLLGALLTAFPQVLMPTFTYKTMITPEVGPQDNAIQYGSGITSNRQAEIFQINLPADRSMGILAESLRLLPQSHRSTHPILSFSGIDAKAMLDAQTIDEPLAPIRCLAESGGWVLLFGVDHSTNTSIHYAERLAGRQGYTRWALTSQGILECPGFPGCSNGFPVVAQHLTGETRQVLVGNAVIQAIPLEILIETVLSVIHLDPLALLCDQPDCERCMAIKTKKVKA